MWASYLIHRISTPNLNVLCIKYPPCVYYESFIYASHKRLYTVSSAQSLSRVQLFVTPWTAAHLASLSITNSLSLLKPTSIESVIPSNHLILCCPLLLLPSIFPSIRVFSSESTLSMRWPTYWSFSFIISPSNEYSGLMSFRMDQLDLLEVQGTIQIQAQFKSINSSALTFLYSPTYICDYWKNHSFD